jgi:hypothetical protein
MKVFHLQEQEITITDTQHRWGNIFGSWDRDTFESLFGHSFPAHGDYFHVEPERALYIAGPTDGSQAAIDATNVHVVWVLENWEFIIRIAAEAQYGADYTYDAQSDSFIITPEQQAIIDKRERQSQRLGTLGLAIKDEFKLIIALFEVGKAQGVWTNADFDEEIRTKAAEWKQIIEDYEAEE